MDAATQLTQHIKSKEFMTSYLLYGDEAYLLNFYKNKLVEEILDGDTSMNYQSFTCDTISIAALQEAVVTMPFFAPKRVIVVEQSGYFTSSKDEFTEILKNIPDTTCVIFVEENINKAYKPYKAINSNGMAVELNKYDESKLVKWVAGRLTKDSWQIERQAAVELIRRCNSDMLKIQNELQKLTGYTLDRKSILYQDVCLLTAEPIDDEIFKMIDAIAMKNQRQALQYYYDLLLLRKAPTLILTLILKHFRVLYKISCSMPLRGTNQEVAAKLGIPPFAVKKYGSQSKYFTPAILREAVEECVGYDRDIKTGLIIDKMAVELIIIKYSTANL